MGAPADWSLLQNQGQLLARLEPITTLPDKTIKKIVFTDQPCIGVGVYMTVAGNLISATHITCTIFVLCLHTTNCYVNPIRDSMEYIATED